MKNILLVCSLLFIAHMSAAQPMYQADSIPRATTTIAGKIIRELSVGLPEAYGGCNFPIRQKGILSMPMGIGNLYYKTKPELAAGVIFVGVNEANRLIGIYYKQRIGIELAAMFYATTINNSDYNKYLVGALPGYYAGGAPTNSTSDNKQRYFGGILYGVAYNIPVKKFLLGTKILAGFDQQGGTYTDLNYQFKEKGTNNVLRYDVHNEELATGKPLLQWHVYFAKQFTGQHKYFMSEIGVRMAYTHQPYHIRATITQQLGTMPETVQQVERTSSSSAISLGAFYTVYLTKKHRSRIYTTAKRF